MKMQYNFAVSPDLKYNVLFDCCIKVGTSSTIFLIIRGGGREKTDDIVVKNGIMTNTLLSWYIFGNLVSIESAIMKDFH